jgi:hypothetical protein
MKKTDCCLHKIFYTLRTGEPLKPNGDPKPNLFGKEAEFIYNILSRD